MRRILTAEELAALRADTNIEQALDRARSLEAIQRATDAIRLFGQALRPTAEQYERDRLAS